MRNQELFYGKGEHTDRRRDFYAFIFFRCSPSQEILAENATFERSDLRGSKQAATAVKGQQT